MRRSIRSFNIHPPGNPLGSNSRNPFPLVKIAFKCPNHFWTILCEINEWISFTKDKFLVLLLGFFVCKYHFAMWIVFLSRSLTKAHFLP